MSNHIDFYFDIISPYAYIAHKKILKHKNIIFNYKPVYLGGLHKLAGIDSPAFNKYKLKNNIEFKWNSNFPINSLNIMRGYISVSKDKQNDYLNCLFDAYWKNNHDLSNVENMSKLIRDLNIDSEEFFQTIKKQSVKDQLIKLTTNAFQKEVFGTPTFRVNNKIFWGQDRLEYALEEFGAN